ncbi:MAG: hypothetical protein ACK4RK_20210 [Gemmataceae bacterium]
MNIDRRNFVLTVALGGTGCWVLGGSGLIGFQDNAKPLWLRNIRIRER